MGKRNKKRKQREAPVEEPVAEEEVQEDEMVQCPTCDAIIKAGLPACPQCGQEFIVEDNNDETVDGEAETEALEEEMPYAGTPMETEEAEPYETEAHESEAVEEPAPEIEASAESEEQMPEFREEEEDAVAETATPQIKKTMLLVGVMFSALGSFGIVGLRAGLVQTIMGYTPSPGIGPQETLGIAVSMIPLALGLIIVLFWGIKNNPAYIEMEKARELEDAADEAAGEDDDDIIESHIGAGEPTPEEQMAEPPGEVAWGDEAMETEEQISEDLEETLAELVSDLEEDVAPEEFRDTLAELEMELDAEEHPPVAEERPVHIEDAQEITGMDLKNLLAEELRTERCEKMLRAVVVLPDDKDRLKSLIADGISPDDFSEEIKKAVERRMKKEKERDVTADEKAAILEDELVADLAELEDEFEKDAEETKELEDEILKEIEDLENL